MVPSARNHVGLPVRSCQNLRTLLIPHFRRYNTASMFFLDGFDSTLSDQRVFPSRRVVNWMYIGGVITRKTVIQGKGVSTTIFFAHTHLTIEMKLWSARTAISCHSLSEHCDLPLQWINSTRFWMY